MGSIVRVSRKHRVAAPQEPGRPWGVHTGDELAADVESGKVMIGARPKGYARYMLRLHKNVWKGVKAEEYVRNERDAWRREDSCPGLSFFEDQQVLESNLGNSNCDRSLR